MGYCVLGARVALMAMALVPAAKAVYEGNDEENRPPYAMVAPSPGTLSGWI